MMDATTVLAILDCVAASGIRVWLDGGWGVDALLGVQTRPHDDLDLVIALADVDAALRALADIGYALIEDQRPTRFMVQADGDRRIDVHPVVFATDGAGIQILHDGSPWRYPPDGFTGCGSVLGREVSCLTPEVQVLAHLGYEPDDDDCRDMRRLADRFGLALPSPFLT